MSDKLSYTFAGTRFNFFCADEILRSPRFAAFESGADSAELNEINITVRRGALPPLGKPDIMRGIREFFTSGENFTVASSYFDGKTKSGRRFSVCKKINGGEYTVTLSPETEMRCTVLFDALPYSEIMLLGGAPIMHASFVTVGSEALLFTGASGTGKTTQARLWQKHASAKIINGDRTAVRITDRRAAACGVPFSGSSGIALNTSAPIRAIVFPVHSSENKAVEMSAGEGAKYLAGNFTYLPQSRKSSDALWDFIGEAAPKLRFIRLFCTPDGRAVSALEKLL